MGCDIHCCWETQEPDGSWVSRDEWTEEDYGPRLKTELLGDRNYRLFGMLANVRNGYGFAGVDTGDAVVPIHDPRGAPADASPEVRRFIDGWGADGHTHSWATLGELLSYDLTRSVLERGTLSLRHFKQWESWGRERGEAPREFSGAVSGRLVRHVSEAEARAMADDPEESSHVYVRCEWHQFYWQLAGELTHKALPIMLADSVKRELSGEQSRLVFFFDN